ncbi:MAG: hypothetical protein ACRDH2_15545 [Anaerolineales bacterium]
MKRGSLYLIVQKVVILKLHRAPIAVERHESKYNCFNDSKLQAKRGKNEETLFCETKLRRTLIIKALAVLRVCKFTLFLAVFGRFSSVLMQKTAHSGQKCFARDEKQTPPRCAMGNMGIV